MDQAYWVFEYVKVLLAYIFVLYIWPSVVFRPHLSGKGRAYRFCFCVNTTVVLVSTAVILLGLVHLLNQVLVMIVYFGVFLIQLFRNYHLGFSWLGDIRSVCGRTMSARRMLLKWHSANSQRLRSAAAKWRQSVRGRRAEYAVLLIAVVFGMMYFSVNALQVHSFGCGDQYVHYQWINSLKEGRAFSSGIYPEGMHAFIYLISAAFGINAYSCVLFLGGIHIQVYIVSAYLLCRALFGWRMSGLFALVAFLTLDQVSVNGITSISRLAWTLPQEFSLYTVFLAAYGLIRFLRRDSHAEARLQLFRSSFWKAVFSDPDLLIFILSITVSICVHFYPTIIAAFVCLVVLVLNLHRVFRRGVFTRLIAGVLIALVISLFPMAIARIAGYPLQGSLYWAMSVVNGKEEEQPPAAADSEEEMPKQRVTPGRLVAENYHELYGNTRGNLLLIGEAAVAVLSVILLIRAALLRRKKEKRRSFPFSPSQLKNYLFISITLLILFIAYKPHPFGLPELIQGSRLSSTITMFAMLLAAAVLDMVFTLAHTAVKDRVLVPVSVAVCLCIYVLAQVTGVFHGYLYYELSRYPAAVELTKEITENLPKQKYTVISTTDELYQVCETGYHEEWIDFIENYRDKTYVIPTEYLFFFIEKHPIRHGQFSFASGPRWLADTKYTLRFLGDVGQYPQILHGSISEESVNLPIAYSVKRSDTETILPNRIIIESRAYAWYEKFSSLHPYDGEVIYEDDDLLCYCIRQNERALFSMGVME